MPRIKIYLPETFIYQTTIPVRITDLNYGRHVGNDSVLSLIHEARMQFLTHFGYSEMDFAGVSLIMADVGIEFVNEAFYGDTIEISIALSDPERVSFDLYYLLRTEREGEKKTIAKAKTGMVCFDYNLRKVTSVPEIIIKKFAL